MRSTVPEVEVSIGVLIRDRRVLLAWRSGELDQGGCWEFPGGKRQAGESAQQTLHREVMEETGLRVQAARRLIEFPHDYPDVRVRLSVWLVTRWSPTQPAADSGRMYRWVAVDRLGELSMPAANGPIVQALGLPPIYLVTGRHDGDDDRFLTRLAALVPRHTALVYLRPGLADPKAYRRLALKAVDVLPPDRATLMLRDAPRLAAELGTGLHLTSPKLMQARARPLPRSAVVAASCHGAAQLHHARAIGVDFATLSPVAATLSHPDRPALGWAEFSRLVNDVALPTYALGGMTPAMVDTAANAGAQGVAVLSALWNCV